MAATRRPVRKSGKSPSPTPPTVDASPAADFNDIAVEPSKLPALAFPVVCVGASAGGLEAFTQLLSALPPDTGMAFVLVSHLSPSHASHLAEILSRSTRMPVNRGLVLHLVHRHPRTARQNLRDGVRPRFTSVA